MAKVTTHVSVKGTDLVEMINQAKEQMADLGDIKWAVTEVNIWGQDDAATRDGMIRMWSAEISLEANVS